jgi:hypothetical protein
MSKTKEEKVVKPLKADALKVVNKEETELKVVNSEGVVVKVFRKAEYGPRFAFKATQYASNFTTPLDPLHVE